MKIKTLRTVRPIQISGVMVDIFQDAKWNIHATEDNFVVVCPKESRDNKKIEYVIPTSNVACLERADQTLPIERRIWIKPRTEEVEPPKEDAKKASKAK